jgi:pyruvate dehydrogenase E2 component (dihydrolipoamide acetyltransferase)
MQGGAITVSNAGMHDVTYMASIINPGQAMILGVGSIREVFRPDESGQPVIRREMGMVLSADHRVLDGVTALKFLKRVVQALSQPMGLLVL